jgi:4-amino-4-deoxy-L-arabinose transferase-like glycosyltransferase
LKNRLILVFVLAVLIRLILATIFYSLPPEWPSGSSKEFRIELAESLAHGKGFSYHGIPNLYQTPVYPSFLAIIFLLFGYHWWSIALFQSLLEGISSILIAKIGDRFSKLGWLAGLIYAIFPYPAMQSRSIVDTALFVAIVMSAVFFFINFLLKPRSLDLFLSAFILGIGILNRPSIFILWPAFVVSMLLERINFRKVMVWSLASLLIAAILPGLWIIRNYKISGYFPVLSVAGQHFMWYGHNAHIYKILEQRESPDLVGIDPRYPMQPNFKVIDFFVLSPAKQVELGKRCSEIVAKWIKNNKQIVLDYTVLKLKMFLSWKYDIESQNAPFQKARTLIYMITTAPILIFGWAGAILLFFRKRRIALFLFIIFAGFIFTHVLTNFESRHKIPYFALLITTIPLTIEFIILGAKKAVNSFHASIHNQT